MKRVSLRIEAIAMALEGAGFIDVFRYFLDAGQSAEESFASAQRVFRGVPLDGGCAFTKDAVYLRGLVGVHTFFRWALRSEEHTSELQSLMRISYAVCCLKQKKTTNYKKTTQ